jgi:hypothetical protein
MLTCKVMKMEAMTAKQFDVFSKRYSKFNLPANLAQEPVPRDDPDSDEPCFRYCERCLKLDVEDSKLLSLLMSRTEFKRRGDVVHEWYRLNSTPIRPPRASKKRKADEPDQDGAQLEPKEPQEPQETVEQPKKANKNKKKK